MEASKGGSCNIIQVGYSVSACGGYSMLPTPMSMAGNIAGFAIGELSAMYRLLQISTAYALSFLLPLGIVLRTFKLTRGAGGFLIALGISMHIFLPMGVIFNEMMAVTFIDAKTPDVSASDLADITQYKPIIMNPAPKIPECNPLDTGSTLLFVGDYPVKCNRNMPPGGSPSSYIDSSTVGTLSEGNDANAVGMYCMLRSDIKGYLFLMLAKATLGPVIALLLMVTGIRTLTSIAGAEVDVTAISRFV